MAENSMACYILHVYTSRNCSGLCLWWIGKITFLLYLLIVLSHFLSVCVCVCVDIDVDVHMTLS